MDKAATEIVDEQLIQELTDWVLLVENEAGIYELSQVVYAMAETENEKGKSLTPPDDIIFTYDHGDDEDFFINNTGISTYERYVRVDKTGRNVLEVIADHRTAAWVRRNIERFINPLQDIIKLHFNNKNNIINVLDFHLPSASEKIIIKFEELLEKYSPIDEDLSWANEASSVTQTFTRDQIIDTILDWMHDQVITNGTTFRLYRSLTVLLETIHAYSVNHHQFNSIEFWNVRVSDNLREVSYEINDKKFGYRLPINYEYDDYESEKRYEMLVNLMYQDFITTAAPLIAHKMYTLILDLCKMGEAPTDDILAFFVNRFNRNLPLAFTKLEFDATKYREDVSWINESAASQELITWMLGLNKRRIQ